MMNPDSKIHGIRLSSGELALSYNNHARAFTGMQKGREGMKRRENLLVSLSRYNTIKTTKCRMKYYVTLTCWYIYLGLDTHEVGWQSDYY
jgi:hypothetical protein